MLHGNCAGRTSRESPICNRCWSLASSEAREQLKVKYNATNPEQKFCKEPGCWGVVAKKYSEYGQCTRQINTGECDMIYDDTKKGNKDAAASARHRSRSRYRADAAAAVILQSVAPGAPAHFATSRSRPPQYQVLASQLRMVRHTIKTLSDQVDEMETSLSAMKSLAE